MKVKSVLLAAALAFTFTTAAAADPITIVVNVSGLGLDVSGLGWGGGSGGAGGASGGVVAFSNTGPNGPPGNTLAGTGHPGGNGSSSGGGGGNGSNGSVGDVFVSEITDPAALLGFDHGLIISGAFGALLLHLDLAPVSPAVAGLLAGGSGGGTSPVPEPTTLLLVGSGLLGLGTSMRHRRRKPNA